MHASYLVEYTYVHIDKYNPNRFDQVSRQTSGWRVSGLSAGLKPSSKDSIINLKGVGV